MYVCLYMLYVCTDVGILIQSYDHIPDIVVGEII